MLTLYFKFLTPYAKWCASRFERIRSAIDQDFYAQNVEEPLKSLMQGSKDLEREIAWLRANSMDNSLDEIRSFHKKMEDREERRRSIEGNALTAIRDEFRRLNEEIGKRGDEQTKLAAQVALFQKQQHTHRALWHCREAYWRTSAKKLPVVAGSKAQKIVDWKDTEAASHCLEVVADNGYHADAKELEDIQVSRRPFAVLQDWLMAEDSRWL